MSGRFDPGSRLRGILSIVSDRSGADRSGGRTDGRPGPVISVGPAVATRIVDARVRNLLAYWEGKTAGRAMPARRDIDPADFAALLSGVALVDVLYDPLRFRYRLVGTQIVERHGREMSGRWVSDIPGPQLRATTMKDYELVVRQKAPVLEQGDEVYDTRRIRYEILRLPLSEDGVLINMILTAAVYGEG